tara:strand:+ start:27644 stop:28825 length:1182 start_codon:yes stop_codon:yes gene_type:complete
MNNYKYKSKLYLDACATSPIRLSVLNKMNEVHLSILGNPSSIHYEGVLAMESLERSRQIIMNIMNGLNHEIIFTSGATESINLAIKGSTQSMNPARIVISAVEHPAVIKSANSLIRQGWAVTYWPVDNYGCIDLSKVEELLAPPTRFVSLIWGQSEVGTIQPVIEIAKLCRDRGILFHCDATQILNHTLINLSDLPFDMISLSGHKIQGPRGIGLLAYNSNTQLSSLILGGEQQNSIRAGTEPIALIAGLAEAIQSLYRSKVLLNNIETTETEFVGDLTNYLRNQLSNINEIEFTGHPISRLSNHISFVIKSTNNNVVSGRSIVRKLSDFGVLSSSGSACSSFSHSDSPVLTAMNFPENLRSSGVRFSLGPWLTMEALRDIPNYLLESIKLCS